MATPLCRSASTTLSIARWLIRLPAVARRSPAMITPSAKRMATHVVACGIVPSASISPRASGGAAPMRRNSSGKLDPGSSPGGKTGIAMDGY